MASTKKTLASSRRSAIKTPPATAAMIRLIDKARAFCAIHGDDAPGVVDDVLDSITEKLASKHLERFSDLTLPQQIERARPVAQALITEGIDTYTREDDSVPNRAIDLIADPGFGVFLEGLREEHRVQIYNAIEAGRAVGIALGLMLRPEAFAGHGDAR